MVLGKMGLAMLWIWTMALFAVSVAATVHKVGDSAGWTTLVPVDYAKWTSSKNFHVGDTILFSYNSKFHNVLQVNKQQYDSCNSSSPAASYNSGDDSITLKRPGTFYFLCGFPGHCQVGQKVEIKVTSGSSSQLLAPSSGPSPSPSPSPSPLPNGPFSPSAPAPSAAWPSTLRHLPHFSLFCLPLLAYFSI